MMNQPTGYLHPAYAASFQDWGEPILLPRSGGSLLVREVAGTSDRDAIGCYPIFTCRNWQRLGEDIDALTGSLVAVSLVTDPFGEFDPAMLARVFPDRSIPFKEHFVADLTTPRDTAISKHHRREAHRALRHFRVEVCARPREFFDDWVRLYRCLAVRHGIVGPQLISSTIFARQFDVPGFTLLRAVKDDVTVGMTIWYEQSDVAYFHLSAFDATGYKWGGASYALLWTAWEWFASRVRWLALGGVAGTRAQDDGLSWFKRGWATSTRTVYFCGRVLDRGRYEALSLRANSTSTHYFPAYRLGELVQPSAVCD